MDKGVNRTEFVGDLRFHAFREETAAAYDRLAAEYATRWGNMRLEQALNAFSYHLGGRRRVLDLGCGPGHNLDFLQKLGCHVVGLDLSSGMLAQARQRTPAALLLRADMRRLPLAAACFDGVWASASLLHLPRSDMPATLAGIARCLLPGGVLYLSLKKGEGEEVVGGEDAPRLLFTYYQPAQAETLLVRAGFRVLEQWISADSAGRPRLWLNYLAELPPVDEERPPTA